MTMNLTALDYVVVAVAAISGTGLTLPVSSVSGVVVSHLAAVPRHVPNRAESQEVWMETQSEMDSMYWGQTGQRRGGVSVRRAAAAPMGAGRGICARIGGRRDGRTTTAEQWG